MSTASRKPREIHLPHNYTPRDYQLPIWQAFDSGYKRLLLVHHRRAGKDVTCINMMARATQERVGTYFYFLPTFAQGRRVIWNGMTGDGFRFLNYIPRDLWDGKPHETEMRIRLINGSVFQVIGSDNIDNVVGTNPVGCVFSEYSLEDPAGWKFISPILRENGGWAIFNGTPRGKANHLYKLYQFANKSKEWWVQKLGVNDTGVLTEEDIEAERAFHDEEYIQQEYFCSFEGGMAGAYYIREMQAAMDENRITSVPFDPELPVHTAWDLGISDSTPIIFFQQSPAGQIRMIDFEEHTGQGLNFYVKLLWDKMATEGYVYGDHIAPWDIQIRELGTGKSRLELAHTLGLKFRSARKLPIDDGINAVRMMLPMCWFDEKKCERLIEALMSYTKTYDRMLHEWRNVPLHNWASHPADAMRTLAVGRRQAKVKRQRDRYSLDGRRSFDTTWMAG